MNNIHCKHHRNGVETSHCCPHLTRLVSDIEEDLPKHVRTELFKANFSQRRSENGYPECPICMERIVEEENYYITRCGHVFCVRCYNQIKKCAFCRKD